MFGCGSLLSGSLQTSHPICAILHFLHEHDYFAHIVCVVAETKKRLYSEFIHEADKVV
jgi:hypothetical protein